MSKSNNNFKKQSKFDKPTNKNNKGGKRQRYDKAYNRNAPEQSRDDVACGYVGKENDPSWYNRLKTLFQDVTKVPFNFQIGRPMDYLAYGSGIPYNLRPTPGVAALDVVTCPGIAQTASDGVNIAATSVFQRLRKDISTYASYASADVMCYVLACNEMIKWYNHILRCFGVVNLYSGVNYNINRSILRSLGFNDDAQVDFKKNLNAYRSEFNTLIYKASTIYFPTQFSITDRHAWLFSNIFTDANSIKGQIYIHRPATIGILDETTYETGTSIFTSKIIYDVDDRPSDARNVYPSRNTKLMAEMLQAFDTQIEAIRNSDSMNKIAADMKRAYNDAGSWKLAYCDENYIVPLTYSAEVLSQIENTSILPPVYYMEDESLDVTQSVNKNIVQYKPIWNSESSDHMLRVPSNMWDNNLIINAHVDNPTNDDVGVMTRDMNVLVSVGSGDWEMSSCGSDYCTGFTIYSYSTRTGGVSHFTYSRFMPMEGLEGSGVTPLSEESLRDYISCDWAPAVYATEWNPSAVLQQIASALIDYNNFTFIGREDLDRIHNNVVTSMWSVPEFGDATK